MKARTKNGKTKYEISEKELKALYDFFDGMGPAHIEEEFGISDDDAETLAELWADCADIIQASHVVKLTPLK